MNFKVGQVIRWDWNPTTHDIGVITKIVGNTMSYDIIYCNDPRDPPKTHTISLITSTVDQITILSEKLTPAIEVLFLNKDTNE